MANSTLDGVSQWCRQAALTAKSVVKIALQSRGVRPVAESGADTVIVMGNGPSLADTLRDYGDVLRSNRTMAVNFAANAKEFREIKPTYYVIADPHFFSAEGMKNPAVARLRDALDSVDWPMTLFLPSAAKGCGLGAGSRTIKIEHYNALGVEGFEWFETAVFGSGRGMPRPRNVLIPAIMVALWKGYRNIYVAGADHSWLKTLSVNDRNEVVSIQPHFYKDDEKEIERVRTDYLNYPLHQVLESMVVAFKSYYVIDRFAKKKGVKVWNVTPGSFIDAFDRQTLDVLRRS